MLQVIDLRTPQLLLVLHIVLIRKVGDAQDGFVGYRALFYAEFKKFILRIMVPTIPDELIVHMLQYLGCVHAAVPGERKDILPLVHLVRKPLLQAYRCRQKIIQYRRLAAYRKLNGVHYFLFIHRRTIHF